MRDLGYCTLQVRGVCDSGDGFVHDIVLTLKKKNLLLDCK